MWTVQQSESKNFLKLRDEWLCDVSCVSQERGGSNAFNHETLTLKYKLDNEFELIFVVSTVHLFFTCTQTFVCSVLS